MGNGVGGKGGVHLEGFTGREGGAEEWVRVKREYVRSPRVRI